VIENLWRPLQERAAHPGNAAREVYRREPDRGSRSKGTLTLTDSAELVAGLSRPTGEGT
jgi:hypothetical protein